MIVRELAYHSRVKGWEPAPLSPRLDARSAERQDVKAARTTNGTSLWAGPVVSRVGPVGAAGLIE
jgi:hypothetical protein